MWIPERQPRAALLDEAATRVRGLPTGFHRVVTWVPSYFMPNISLEGWVHSRGHTLDLGLQ
jgi:hypothetical protein